MKRKTFKPGDQIVVCRMRHRSNPSPRAEGIQPAANGDTYCYYVKKYWVVDEVLEDGKLLCRTPRGKKHLLNADDPTLWHANIIDRIVHRDRYQRSRASLSSV